MSKVINAQLLHFCNNCITTICDWLIVYHATFHERLLPFALCFDWTIGLLVFASFLFDADYFSALQFWFYTIDTVMKK